MRISYRDKVKKMLNHVACLQSRAKQLQREQDSAQERLDVFEGLLYARIAWTAVVKAVLQPGEECDALLEVAQQSADPELLSLLVEPVQESERILQQMPMLPALSAIDRELHAVVTQLTASEAARQYVTFVSDTMRLLTLHELDEEAAAPLLASHMTRVLAWLFCLYSYNAPVAFELHNTNLLTRARQAPPKGHWQRVLAAAEITDKQLRQIATANQYVAPRLRQLQQEQQRLLQELYEVQQGQDVSEAAAGHHMGAGAGHNSPKCPPVLTSLPVMMQLPGLVPQQQAAGTGAPHACLDWAAPASTAAASQYRHAAAATPAGPQPHALSSHSSNRERQHQMARANDLAHKIAANCLAWRVVASMRGHYSASVLQPLQVARLVTAAAPYLLLGAPIYDEINASQAVSAASARKN